MPDVPDSSLAPLLDWARTHLDRPVTLRLLAREAGTTTRTLTRRFTAELGLPPLQWLTAERVRRAPTAYRSAFTHSSAAAATTIPAGRQVRAEA